MTTSDRPDAAAGDRPADSPSTPGVETATAARDGATGLEQTIARLLTIGTYAAVALFAIGSGLLLAAGGSPLDGGPRLDIGRVGADLGELRFDGFLWLGLLIVIATPAARVGVSFIGYLRAGERSMALVAALILGIISLSVALAIGTEG